VVSPDVGGGFGPRTALYIEQLAVAWAARQVGRPVKWTGDRSEAFVSDYQGRDVIIRAAYAFDRDGRMLAISNEWIGNVGAHPVAYTPMANGTNIMSTVYHIPVVAVKVSGVLTNTVPTAPYRGAGRPEATHAMERMLDIAAHELGIDRVEIRRRNLIRRDMLPYMNPRGLTYDSGDFHGNMERALMLSEWNGFEQRRAMSHARGRLRGIGLANYIEAPVGAPKERIEMTILPDGIVDIVSGTQSTGQGHETTFAQVVAERLRVPVASVRLRTGDTAFVSAGGGTHSDRSMRLGGMLLVQACAEVVERGKPAAAEMLGTDQDSILFRDGVYTLAGSQRSVSLFDIARRLDSRARGTSPRLRAVAEFTGRMAAHPTGAAVCELDIDPDTGNVEIVAYTSIDDVGRPINPLIVEGQVHGGLAQGIGQAFSEGYYVDRESGQVASGSYMDYGVPRSTAMPPLKLEFTEDPTQGNPLGVKGGGESGITPATAAIFNALCDALKEFGAEEIPMPATPSVLWNIIHRQRQAA
jgi:carbon-monoxide dehydrogenase large subunit